MATSKQDTTEKVATEASTGKKGVFAPKHPLEDRFHDSDAVKYVGVATTRTIHPRDLEAVGVKIADGVDNTTPGVGFVWDASNDWQLEVPDNEGLQKVLLNDGNFLLPESLKDKLLK